MHSRECAAMLKQKQSDVTFDSKWLPLSIETNLAESDRDDLPTTIMTNCIDMCDVMQIDYGSNVFLEGEGPRFEECNVLEPIYRIFRWDRLPAPLESSSLGVWLLPSGNCLVWGRTLGYTWFRYIY
jgi:hypothetical protein